MESTKVVFTGRAYGEVQFSSALKQLSDKLLERGISR